MKVSVTADSALPDYQELRTQANALKKHAIDNLDHYLEEFERNVETATVDVKYPTKPAVLVDGSVTVRLAIGVLKFDRVRPQSAGPAA